MKVMLALRKLGFKGDEITEMSQSEAEGYLEAYNEIVKSSHDKGGKSTTYIVKRKEKQHG